MFGQKNNNLDKLITQSEIKHTLIKPDYEGCAKVLKEFKKLYKVCDNKDMLDECLKDFFKRNL